MKSMRGQCVTYNFNLNSGSETDISASTSTENLTHEEKYVLRNSTRQDPQGEETLYNRLADQLNPNDLAENRIYSLYIDEDMHRLHRKNLPLSPQLVQRKPPVVPYDRTVSNLTYQSSAVDATNNSSEADYLDESSASKMDLRHPYNPTYLPPMVYPKWKNAEGWAKRAEKNGKGKMPISRSQPDLSQVGKTRWEETNSLPQRPRTRGRATSEAGNELMSANAQEMIVLLTKENLCLKAELDSYYNKISKLPKLELEIQNVHQSYEGLVKSSEKREQLSRAVRVKLEMEIKRLQEVNSNLIEQLDFATSHHSGVKRPEDFSEMEFKSEINRRDVLIAQLIAHNKELVAAKERQEVELSAQRATLQEQRTHIDILDKALTNAQANVIKIEEECRKKQAYVERVAQLQKAINALQVASDKREKMEKRLRNQLEKEILELRSQNAQRDCKAGETAIDESADLKQQLRENEEKLMNAQTELSRWEQKYLEENALRQIAIDAAAMPKDAKIAALERSLHENERVIAQGRAEKLKQMEDVHLINKRCVDLEAKIKDLESKLAEKDAMIKVLQRQSVEKDMAFQNAIMRSPRHTPHPSLHAQLSSTVAMNEEPSDRSQNENSCIPSVAAALSSLSITSTSNSLTNASKSYDLSQANNVDELKNLDSQILSKDSIIQALRAEKEKYPSHFWRV